jgi:DNA modification methylase
LWFSNSRHPYCDAAANGTPSERIGLIGKKGRGRYIHSASSSDGCHAGVARCRDYVEVSTSAVNRDRSNHHPAQYPEALAEWIIRLLCPPNGVVLDSFLGSGATAAAAKATGRRFVGTDIDPRYVEIARARLRRMTTGKTVA